MTTQTLPLTKEKAIDFLWKTAAANCTGRIGQLLDPEALPLESAIRVTVLARRIEWKNTGLAGQFILTLHGLGGVLELYVRPFAAPWDPTVDPWSR